MKTVARNIKRSSFYELHTDVKELLLRVINTKNLSRPCNRWTKNEDEAIETIAMGGNWKWGDWKTMATILNGMGINKDKDQLNNHMRHDFGKDLKKKFDGKTKK